MAINSYFFNAVNSGGTYDRIYNAEDVTSYLDKIVSDGVFANPSDQLKVRKGTGMQVIVGEGSGWIKGHKMVNTADLILSVDAADPLLFRIDMVVFYLDYNDREMGIEIKKGTASNSKLIPRLTRNSERWELCLALINISAGSTSISNAYIVDTRAATNMCGFVTGLINQVDTSELFTQYEAAYAEQLASMQEWTDEAETSFNNWFDTLTSQLLVNTYIKKYEKNLNLNGNHASGFVVPVNPTGYTYSQGDIIEVYLNGLRCIEGSDWSGSVTDGLYSITFANPLNRGTEVGIRVLKAKIGDPAMTSGFGQLTIDNVVSATSTDEAEGEIS